MSETRFRARSGFLRIPGTTSVGREQFAHSRFGFWLRLPLAWRRWRTVVDILVFRYAVRDSLAVLLGGLSVERASGALFAESGFVIGSLRSSKRPANCSADLRVCCAADFQIRSILLRGRLEVGDTAGWETCATERDLKRKGAEICSAARARIRVLRLSDQDLAIPWLHRGIAGRKGRLGWPVRQKFAHFNHP